MQAVTLTAVEQSAGALVLIVGAFLVVVYGGGYIWYRLIGYPVARRGARQFGFVVVGENAFGDSVMIAFAETDWRAATFKEWRSMKTYEGESAPRLWPTRTFEEGEYVS